MTPDRYANIILHVQADRSMTTIGVGSAVEALAKLTTLRQVGDGYVSISDRTGRRLDEAELRQRAERENKLPS